MQRWVYVNTAVETCVQIRTQDRGHWMQSEARQRMKTLNVINRLSYRYF